MLNEREQAQIEVQVQNHSEVEPYELDIELGRDIVLERFRMLPGVLKPMSSIFLARFLCANRELYAGRTVIDMGCGSGIQGIAAALSGAELVVFSDVAPAACENTLSNIKRCGVESRSRVVEGDLFENVADKAELIVFAQPYFPGEPWKNVPVTLGMLDPGELIQRFLRDARSHAKGRILMPFIDWISAPNNPAIQGPGHGYSVREVCSELSTTGVQRGVVSVYELSLPLADGADG